MLRANEVVKRLGGSWMLQSEAQRQRVTTLPTVAWSSPVLALLDQERRRALLEEPGSRETCYYMTLSWWPPSTSTRSWRRAMVSGAQPALRQRTPQEGEGLTGDQRISLLEFVREADAFMDLLKGMLAAGRPLTIDETTTYLHNCVSNRWYTLGPLAFYQDLDAQLCDTPFVGGWYPYLGVDPTAPDTWHLRTCSIMGYPATSVVGTLRHLDAANLDYRWCTRWVGLEKQAQAGLLRNTQGAWMGQEKSLMGRVAESLSNQPQRILNTDATNRDQHVVQLRRRCRV